MLPARVSVGVGLQQMVSKQTAPALSLLARTLHWTMLALSAVASAALFLLDSLPYRALLTLLLLAYAAFLLRHRPLPFLARTPPAKPDHLRLREWTPSTPQEPSLSSNPPKPTSRESEPDRSQLHDSFSSFRGQSASHLNDSHISTSRRLHQTRGGDLLSLLTDKSEAKSVGRSSGLGERGALQVVDRKAMARKRLHGYKSEGERGYEEQLAEAGKTAQHVQSRYPALLSHLHALLNPLLNEHSANSNKIRELSLEFLDIQLDDSAQPDPAPKRNHPLRIANQALLERYFTAYVRKEPIEMTGLPLRAGKKWAELEKRLNELLRARVRLAEALGVGTEDLSSQVRRGVGPFVAQYAAAAAMLEGFAGKELSGRLQGSLEELSEDGLLREFKNRIFALSLFVRHLNSLLRGSPRIVLRDLMGFGHAGRSEGEFEIVARYSFDAYVPYYNLEVRAAQGKKVLPCEYGPNNYLSILYFLILALATRPELRERPELARIANDVL